ncbi:N-acetylmuramoyl-L-alanine amidase [Paenibacillus abyssi]|uniref:N-acetylmuramoyl-L-alanine amidase n=1 Tax=Paenibacillus abyssi TaxID=1340531 RepID=A0A917CH11_9BACL|nr:N-acetylmuramoyl-L-alanine amidase [Paenibacillus abyssi]GGF88624.1 hypothetical protein GCM10010916_02430 [Paenibacillus abyssi]
MDYVLNHIPLSTPRTRRPATLIEPSTITIHNTGNPTSTAANERGWLTNPSNTRRASFHIAVDERGAVECIPLNEAALHAGSAEGNRTSIGVEICESGNYAKTLENAVELVAAMLTERGWGVDRLRRHYDWSGKICPRLMYDDGKWTGWEAFKKAVEAKMNPEVPNVKLAPVSVVVNGNEIADGHIVDGVTYVPVRSIAEALGASITWDQKTRTVTLNTK